MVSLITGTRALALDLHVQTGALGSRRTRLKNKISLPLRRLVERYFRFEGQGVPSADRDGNNQGARMAWLKGILVDILQRRLAHIVTSDSVRMQFTNPGSDVTLLKIDIPGRPGDANPVPAIDDTLYTYAWDLFRVCCCPVSFWSRSIGFRSMHKSTYAVLRAPASAMHAAIFHHTSLGRLNETHNMPAKILIWCTTGARPTSYFSMQNRLRENFDSTTIPFKCCPADSAGACIGKSGETPPAHFLSSAADK